MQVLQLPTSLPGKCSLCGASDNNDGREYVDIGFEIDFYGVIYFCTHCFSEISTAVGYSSKSYLEAVEASEKEALDKVSKLEAENVKLRVSFSQLDFLGSHADSSVDSKKSVEQKRRDNSKPVKQTDEPGPTNVPKTGKSNKSADLEDLL